MLVVAFMIEQPMNAPLLSPGTLAGHAASADALVSALHAIVGDRGLLTDPSDTAPYCTDWRGLYHGRTPAVVRPDSTPDLAAVIALCAEQGVAVVPQGGNTSMVGGGAPSEDGRQVVVSLSRMNQIRRVDATDMTMTVEAGVPWRVAQDAAAAAGCLLPLSISSEGTAQVGGILATNAGGNTTVRYGNARDLVLGLEVVLPDGQVWDGLRSLRKDNTGYCLRQLFVGAEGTLGVISAAVLKLEPALRETVTALCAVPTVEAATMLFRRFQGTDPAAVQAFEYMSGAGMDMVLRHIPGTTLPIANPSPHYALVELGTPRPDGGLRAMLEALLEAAFEDGTVSDAAIAESTAQRLALWRLREEHAEAQKRNGTSVKNDVSVPPSRVPDLIREAAAACEALLPGIPVVPFGHLGDGNIHFNLAQPPGMDGEAFLARSAEIMGCVNAVVSRLDGSFSAEHGVGRLKPSMMPKWRGGAELDAMRRIKHALDPAGIMNPGKVLP